MGPRSGKGRTADIDRPLSVELMSDDIAALITHLGLRRPDVMGYSLGGGVAVCATAAGTAPDGRNHDWPFFPDSRITRCATIPRWRRR